MKLRENALSVLLALSMLLPLAPARAAQPVEYLPGVTEEMTDPGYWAALMDDPDAALATPEEIARINAEALTTGGSNMHDLKNLSETFDGVARCEALKRSTDADGKYYLGWTYSSDGKKLEQADFDEIGSNCDDPEATEEMRLRYGVAVNRTALLTFPYDGQILDDPADFDFDYQALVGIRVNEPVAIFTASADGKFYSAYTSCCSGWVRAEDIAICADREEWLSAWDIPAEKRLVFCGDKMYTDYSNVAPETSGRLLTMATVLERMDALEIGELVINRLPLHNYAVYLPVRNEDGSYAKKPALINAREAVSEDYPALTGRNLAAVALASLGDTYGWGGGMNNDDCTGLDRCVFLCFGLDLPRNGNWQRPLAMPKADTTYMTTEEKEALLDALPLGSLLNFPGHQMLYLGKSGGEYYVVSSVSAIMSPDTGKRQRTRDVQLNTLNIRRANGKTWLEALTYIYIPWQYLEPGAESPLESQPWYHSGTAYCLENKLIDSFDGGYFRPSDSASRSAAIEALWRAAGKPEPSEGAESFSDVESGAAYEKAVLWAKEQGIADGINGMFLPDAAVTREQLAAMLFRLAKAEEQGGAMGLAGYEDAADVSGWAYGMLGWAVQQGLINGRSGQTIDARAEVTRAELAVITQRVCEGFLTSENAAE